MTRMPLARRDLAPLVQQMDPHRAGALAVALDHEATERFRLALGLRDLLEQHRALGHRARTEERPHIVVGEQLEQEVRVVGARAPDRDAAHASEASAPRRRTRSRPVPRATPPRMSARPPSAAAPNRSPRKMEP